MFWHILIDIIIINVFIKYKILSVETVLRAYTYTHRDTHTYKHTDYTKLNLHNLKQAANQDSRWIKTAVQNIRHGRSIIWGKEMFYRLHLNESREGFCGKGRGRSFHVDGLKTEQAQEPAVESLVPGFWRL